MANDKPNERGETDASGNFLFQVYAHIPCAPERFHRQAILALVRALEYHKSNTSYHALNVTMFSVHLAYHLSGTHDVWLDDIFWGAPFHDVGKITVPQRILQKDGSLSPEEWEVVRSHPVAGYHILESVELAKGARDMVLYHHERWDGKGYPYGLAGTAIPPEARICALAGAFEAMTSDRTYRNRITDELARAELRRGASAQFDPELVEVFLRIDPQAWLVLRHRALSVRVLLGDDRG
ncbi:MAG: HD-GYP domain-containing protein [Firmicutes bacterium]|nr:HD-GYP domain-containing protein [Bacillota bacterium]